MISKDGLYPRGLLRFLALPALAALSCLTFPAETTAAQAEVRRSCGTAWTGWGTVPNPDVNPCPAGCVRGERLQERTYGQGAGLQFDVQYQCWFPEDSSGQSISGSNTPPSTNQAAAPAATSASPGSTTATASSGTGLTGPAVITRDPRFAVGAGRNHAVGVRADGVVVTWWENDRGQLGRGTIDAVNLAREPEPLAGISHAVAAAAGPEFSLVLLADGTVLAWGANDEGQLGLGAPGVFPRAGTAMPPVPTPTRIPALLGVRQIAVGERFALALLEDGTVMAWGDGQLGALGDGKGTGSGSHYAVPFPRPVQGLGRAKAIAAGSAFGLALLEDGTVMGWGANEYGQMGDDAVDFKPTPIVLEGLSGVKGVAASPGGRTGFALLEDGSVVAWGKNDGGLLGPGSRDLEKSARPRPVVGLRNVVGLEASHLHIVALLADGTVRGWGGNNFDQLGGEFGADGFAQPALTGVAGVFAGGYRTYYLMDDGRLMVAGFRMADATWRTPVFLTSLGGGGDASCESPAAGSSTGGWKLSADGVDSALLGSTTQPQQAQMLATADRFRELAERIYPQAVSIEAQGMRFLREAAAGTGGPMVFGYESSFLGTVCDEPSGRVLTVGGTGTGSEVVANDLDHLLQRFGDLEIDGRLVTVYQLAPSLGELGGLPLYEPWGTNARAVLAARAGSLPFKAVSRGQYLEGVRLWWEAAAAKSMAAQDGMEIELEREIERVKQELSGEVRDQVVAEMERALAELRAQKANIGDVAEAGVAEELVYIETYLSQHGAADLAKPAVLTEFGFRGEFADGSPNGRQLVLMDETYWLQDLARTAPQLIVVYWQWRPGMPQDEQWSREFESSFDFGQLLPFLGR